MSEQMFSTHFAVREFACHHCGESRATPDLIAALERLRTIIGRPLVIVSGFRCATHNRRVGGARKSQHLLGRAADLRPGVVRIEEARAAGLRGIGHCDGWVVHVDMRTSRRATFLDC